MRCTATARTTGLRCRRGAIHGGTVCKKHGGAAPQVKKAARERLEELVHPAIDRIQHDITNHQNGAVGAMSARDLLDRTGFKPVDKSEQTIKRSTDSKLLEKAFSLKELKEMRKRMQEVE